MRQPPRIPPLMRRLTILLLALLSASCGSIESKRVQDLLVRQGFGKRAEGDAQAENYALVGSSIQFFVPTPLLQNPSYGDLLLLVQTPQTVSVDGTIYIPGYGSTQVLGLSEKKIGALVREQLQALYSKPIQLDARLLSAPKFYYVIGEVLTISPQAFEGDLTVAEAFLRVPRTNLANIGKVKLIRGDPRNPLVVTVNMWDILLYGNTTYNLNVRENDIIYIPPTLVGQLTRLIEKITAPMAALWQAIFYGQNLRYQWDVITGEQDAFYFGSPYLF